jgi:hypothetical protein
VIRRPWTTGEIEKLRDLVKREVIAEVAAKTLERTINATRERARRVGLHFKSMRSFSDEEDAIIRRKYTTARISDLAAELGRPESSVRYRAAALGVSRGDDRWRRWSYRQIRILRQTASLPASEVAKRLRRTERAIQTKRSEMGFAAKFGSHEHHARIARSAKSHGNAGASTKTRVDRIKASDEKCHGWPSHLSPRMCRVLTMLDDYRNAGREWVDGNEIDKVMGVRLLSQRIKRLIQEGLVERCNKGRQRLYRVTPGTVRLVPSEAREIENPADLETEHERRIRMKIAEMEAAAKAGLLDDANPVAQQWDRDSRNTKRRRKVREWQLTKGAA